MPIEPKQEQTNPKMKPIEAAQVHLATELAATELTKFIDFIQYHNPGIDRVTAIEAAVFCLHQMHTTFLEEPEMMQQLSAIALRFSQS